MRQLIGRGNLKLGVLPSFSLPPKTTCPGRTPFCDKYCFGYHGNFIFESVIQSNRERFKVSLTDEFIPRIIAELSKSRAPAFRLHVVGDFYSGDYARKWIEIVQQFPDIHFFGSTRSWRVPKIRKAVEELRDKPNVYMRASTDFTDTLTPGPQWAVWSVDGRGESCPHDRGRVLSC